MRIQHKVALSDASASSPYFPGREFRFRIRSFLVDCWVLFHATGLIGLGIIFFSCAVALQLITLPVEFNASNRARDIMVRRRVHHKR